MEEWLEEIDEIRKKLEEAANVYKQVRRADLIGKTISIKYELVTLKRKLKSKKRTTADLKRHKKLMAGIKALYSMYEMDSPLMLLQREIQLLYSIHSDLIKISKDIIAELTEEDGLPS